ncbi:MAG: TY-Chap domain-containing protein [Planctomycetota bacterium]
MNNQDRISTALADLLNRSSDDAFVIIEEKRTGKFVQFAGSTDGPLLLDLPTQTLTQAEQDRAQELFVSLGTPGLEKWAVTDHTGAPAGTQAGFQMEFGRDPDAAAAVAMRVFHEVYRFPDVVELVITQN